MHRGTDVDRLQESKTRRLHRIHGAQEGRLLVDALPKVRHERLGIRRSGGRRKTAGQKMDRRHGVGRMAEKFTLVCKLGG